MAIFCNWPVRNITRYSSCSKEISKKGAPIFALVLLLFVSPTQGQCFDFENNDVGFDWIDCETGAIVDTIDQWRPSNNESLSGVWSLESNISGMVGDSMLCRRVKRPDNFTDKYYVNFSWKLSGGMFICDVEGFNKQIRRGAHDWENMSYLLDDDEERLIKLQFVRTGTNEDQYGWIDDLQIGPCNQKPEVKLESPADNVPYHVDTKIGFNYTPSDDKKLEYCALLIDEIERVRNESPVSGINYTLYHTFDTRGNYSWGVICCDNNTQCTQVMRNLSIEDPYPKVELDSPANGSTGFVGESKLRFIPSDNKGIEYCTLYVNESPKKVESGQRDDVVNTFNYKFDEPSNYSWFVECCDEFDQCNASSETWVIEIQKNLAPTVELISPEDGNKSYFVNQPVYFEYVPEDDKELDYCTLVIDGNETNKTKERPTRGEVDSISNWTFDKCGNHSWEVICFDNESASNEDREKWNISIQEDKPPVVSAVSPTEGYVNQTIEFKYTPTDDCGLERCVLCIDDMECDNCSDESPNSNTTNSFNYIFPQNRTYTWNITCWDSANNSNSMNGSIPIARPDNVCVYQNGTSQCEAGAFDVEYTKIGDAIRDLKEEGTVTVKFGNYTENLYINKPITLKGCKDARPVIYGNVTPVIIDSDNVTIRGVTINGNNISNSIFVHKDIAKINIIDDHILNSKDTGIYLHGKTEHSIKNIHISSNKIIVLKCPGVIGIDLNNCTDVVIDNNIIGCNVTPSYGISRTNCEDIDWYQKGNIIHCSRDLRPSDLPG